MDIARLFDQAPDRDLDFEDVKGREADGVALLPSVDPSVNER
jgi:hypothetical protein